MRQIDENEIRRAVYMLHNPNDEQGKLFEVRVIGDRWNLSGYFTDADTLIYALQHSETRQGENIYITLNCIDAACYSRMQKDKLMRNVSPTTSDKDVKGWHFLMIDLDPERIKGTSSSAEELKAAKDLAGKIFKYMKATGWYDPIVAESGNGIHLLYRIQVKYTQERTQTIKDCLTALDLMFSNEMIKVDTTTFNPARVCKLYGTIAQKGASTQERPHRLARIIYAPQTLQINDIALIEALAAKAPQPETPNRTNHYNPTSFDLQDFIARHGIQVAKAVPHEGGMKYVLAHCVFNQAHKAPDAAIIQTADGKICYHCFHNSCSDKHWRDVRLQYEPDAYSYDAPRANFRPNRQMPALITQPKQQSPVWLTAEQIAARETEESVYIKSGIMELDKRLVGLKKGFVTLLTGVRACGKSSLISQIALTAADAGCTTAIFSGELSAGNALRWMTMQAAGKAYTRPSRYEGKWYVPEQTAQVIYKWMADKILFYDNNRDNAFAYQSLRTAIEMQADMHQLDLVILDNMMCLDLSDFDRDIFVRQSQFVNDLEQLAKQKNLHIILIAHPRKSNGFLRLQDVSGSNDIVNRVDNALIMHRVNHDFKVGAKAEFRWPDDHEIFGASNVIEICKDRDGGEQDVFIPLYFEAESKRLRSDIAECIHYGWEKQEAVIDEPPF